MLQDQSRSFSCDGDCGVSVAQGDGLVKAQEAFAATEAAWDWTERLYDAGTPVDGPLRILVMVVGVPDTWTSVPWPLAEPVEDFLVAEQFDPPSFLITDPGETQILRQLRQELVDGQLGNDGADAILIEPPPATPRLALYMRDTVPLEDALGHIPLP